MLQIKNLTITHKKDLRIILEDFNMVLNDGDKAVIIGEEGNGKSTLMKWIYDPDMAEEYAECQGERVLGAEMLGYLPQELPKEDKTKTLYEYFSAAKLFFDKTPKELAAMASEFQIPGDFFYSDQIMESLSGGEKVKAQLMRLLMDNPTVLLLDEPSNDIDISTLELLEKLINNWKHIVLYISHDETLIENTANMIIHIEQIMRKTKSRYTIVKDNYKNYIKRRAESFERQEQQAINDRNEKKRRDEKYARVYNSVEHALSNVSRQAPGVGKNLKDKMHTVKAMGKRFEKEDENMTKMPEQEEAIFFKLGNESAKMPAGKTVIEYELDELKTPDGNKVLAKDIFLRVRGPEKICIVGTNGVGKTTLLKKMADELLGRSDIKAQYMPQNYEELLDLDATPVEFLDDTGDKAIRTRIRTYLGSLKYTADEMDHPIRELSGGQKAKVLLLKMSLSDANVLILDEPTRNFSPLSGPVIRKMIASFPGAVISISHDRKYIEEVCTKTYTLTKEGLE
ncbi:ATPase components of ABC transporters with duplicated ATPase domains [Butyrivibrio fibrisolvens DSM 3071]|uniref:ATPase components of ABC transporters with duplicated ATPase domains n=1 Tax=Butyrivibrio fibrisolvens DSM 3071 TaxID=1121131 RepID=A0A1M6ASS5_BUTFI|nr:ATP-binding cassette domain-containing protein [Butyrivibrio fibrisolvens]SHI39554.1 ATPase components of ABC transporters with duplicated ATPase domains [Butyrivibrio fibrisolvens DSM 3071]